MHQTKKGNQWRFGMKAHICVDADSGLVHTVFEAAANSDPQAYKDCANSTAAAALTILEQQPDADAPDIETVFRAIVHSAKIP